MKKINYCLLLGFLCILMNACEKPKGCTNAFALNYDFEAEHDNGLCTFTAVTFYQQFGFFNGIPLTKCEVFVDGNLIGSTSAFYNNGVGNCSALGTVQYQFKTDKKLDWNSKNYLQNGTILLGSGTIQPSRGTDCLKVNVTQ